MKFCPIPEEELWRVTMLTEMLLYRNCDFVKIDNFLKEEINDIIDIWFVPVRLTGNPWL